MLLELLIVVVLIVVNGLFALSELAVVSSRPARLKVMAAEGSKGAAVALNLSENPGRFLSSVQAGVTLVGVLSGAFRARPWATGWANISNRWGSLLLLPRRSAWASSSLPLPTCS